MRRRSPPPFDRRRSPAWRDRRGSRDRRRSRSFSPGRDRSRRPSPTYKRFRRDDDRYDRRDRRSPGRGAYDRERYDGRESYRGGNRRGESRGHDCPDSYKEFILKLSDDVGPEAATEQYQEYVAGWWDSRAKAEFERKKGEQWMIENFDPRTFSEAIERRQAHALEAAEKFSKSLKSGDMDPTVEAFNQGAGPNAPKPEEARSIARDEGRIRENDGMTGEQAGGGDTGCVDGFVGFAPAACWRPSRVRSDLKLSRELIAKLDNEKGVEGNPLLIEEVGKNHLQSAEGAHTGVEQVKEAETGGAEGPMDTDCATADPGGKGQDDAVPAGSAPGRDIALQKAEQVGSVDSTLLAKLDLQLAYLWNVHYTDFYAGHELSEVEYKNAKCRMIRGSKPEVGEDRENDADQALLHELEKRIDLFWRDRIGNGDPLEATAQTRRVEQGVEDFIESQVTQLEDKKWGNKLSTKLFMGKQFVLKHIRLKHKPVLQAEREKILDEIYYENYKKEMKAEEQRLVEERRAEEEARRDQAVDEGPDRLDEVNKRDGHMANWGPMGGRRGGMPEAPMMAGPMMAGPMGQVLLPAPGAGPLGPFILQPVPTPPMDVGPMARPDQRRGMQYGGWGRAGGPMTSHRDYHDFQGHQVDAPQHSRAVLDYGDL